MIEEISNEVWIDFKKQPTLDKRNNILMHYIKLVKLITARIAPIYNNHFEFDDLYSSGIFGLMDAIEKFDINKGIKFSTYATWRIKGSIIDYVREQDWLPKSMIQKFKKVEQAYKQIEIKTGKYPNTEQVAVYLNTTVNDINKILRDSYYYQIISMDEKIMDISNFNGDGEKTPESAYLKNELNEILLKTIDKLTENEKMVVSLYYFDELSQKEIAKVMGISESRISQLHSRALIKLRASLQKHNLIEA